MPIINKHVAVIDVGSNSTKLGVYKETTTQFKLNYTKIGSSRVVTKLGDKVVNGRLPEEVKDKLINTLIEQLSVADLYRVPKTRTFLLLTAWFRSLNKDYKEELSKELEEKTGAVVLPLGGKKEAEYAYLSVQATMIEESGNVCDVGGGSVEVSSFFPDKNPNFKSYKLGVSYLKKYFNIKTRPNRTQRERITEFVMEQLENKKGTFAMGEDVICLAGSGISVFAIFNSMLGIEEFPSHSKSMSKKDLEELMKHTSKLSYESLINVPFFDKSKWDLTEIAMSIYLGIMNVVEAHHLVCARTSIREGFLSSRQED